jgi:regulator of ribonuclease activity A
MKYSTPDLCDAYPDSIKIAEPLFKSYGGKTSFGGEIVTVKCFEDNSRVKELAGREGNGMVMVVDGGGSLKRALLGDLIAEDARKNGWQGFVIFGCIRDVDVISNIDIGVKALNSIPLKTQRKGKGELNVPVTFAGVTFSPGEFIYADETGIIVSGSELIVPE